MSGITRAELDAMRNTDIRTVDPDTLTDIRDVKINADLPKNERILDFISQIRNPYCFKYGDIIIKITFSDSDGSGGPSEKDTLEERFENYLKSL